MAVVQFIFSRPRYVRAPGAPAILLFNEADLDVVAALDEQITSLDADDLSYDTGAVEYITGRARAAWQQASPINKLPDLSWRSNALVVQSIALRWQQAQQLYQQMSLPWRQLLAVTPSNTRADWQQGQAVFQEWRLPWQQSIPVRSGTNRMAWRQGLPDEHMLYARWQQALPTNGRPRRIPWQQALPKPKHVRVPWGPGKLIRPKFRTPWQQGNRVTSIGGPWTPHITPPPPPFVCYIPSTTLVFKQLAGPATGLQRMIFVCELTAGIVVPQQRTYIVINDVTLVKVAGGITLKFNSLNIRLDYQSFTWSFTANLPYSEKQYFDDIDSNVELLATINGYAIRLVTETGERQRVFNDRSWNISGRGRGFELADPVSPILTTAPNVDMTAAQLVDEVLKFNGVPIGWTSNWLIEDWLVPAGVFNTKGTYIDGVLKVARAAGGYVLPHPTDKSFKILHEYPDPPWNWGTVTPDIDLPYGPIDTEGIRFFDKTPYNRVYVAGERGAGYLVEFTKTGTAGDFVAPGVVDPLITSSIPGRQRGRQIIGNTGRQAWVSLKLPVLPSTSVINPGKYLRYFDGTDYRMGITRSLQLTITPKTVWQTVEVETHV